MGVNIGWKVIKNQKNYSCSLQPLSEDEQEFLAMFFDRFSEFSKNHDLSKIETAHNAIDELLPQVLLEEQIEADEAQVDYLKKCALSHLVGFAPLDKMIYDPQIEEIAVIGVEQPIYVFIRKKGWCKTDAQITSVEYLTHLINKMARPLGRRITFQTPRINALLPSGSRLHATIPPLSAGEITIRLHTSKPWSITDILESKATNEYALALLWLAFQSDSTVLIAGNTASGKTTLLNSLFSFVKYDERILQIEETPEIRLLHKHCVKLVCNDDISISMSELVRDSLRMRPDRVIVGEVRTKSEVEAYVETLLSGQARGSYATFHAQSAKEALRRMQNLGVMHDDLQSLDFIVVQRRIALYDQKTKKQSEVRKMCEICMVSKIDTQPICIFKYDVKKDTFFATENLDMAIEFISQKLGLEPKQTKQLYEKRAQFLKKLKINDFEENMEQIQKFAYAKGEQ